MTAQIFNQFMEELIWTNYGGPLVTLLGRDIAVFIIGYLTHIILWAFIEILKGRKNENHNRDNFNRNSDNGSDME